MDVFLYEKNLSFFLKRTHTFKDLTKTMSIQKIKLDLLFKGNRAY